MLTIRNLNAFPSVVDQFFNHELPYVWNRNWATDSSPAVNVLEGKDEFTIEVAAPGLNKEDFHINLENNVLTVSAKKETKQETNDALYTRKEFSYASFSRSFTLPSAIVSETIAASHANGVLTIVVPKHEDAKVKPAREISVA